jgi:hypothetical protein
MCHAVFWILLVLGLPQVAAAAAATDVAAEPVFPGGEPAIERVETPATATPGLDLRIDAKQLWFAQDPSDGASASAAEGANRDVGGYEPHADRGLSFGLEIKPRSRIGALAREDGGEDSGLDDQLQKLIEHPVLGVRGRYRF